MELEPASDSRLRRLTLSYRWRIQFYVIDPSLSPRYGCGQAVLRGWIREGWRDVRSIVASRRASSLPKSEHDLCGCYSICSHGCSNAEHKLDGASGARTG